MYKFNKFQLVTINKIFDSFYKIESFNYAPKLDMYTPEKAT